MSNLSQTSGTVAAPATFAAALTVAAIASAFVATLVGQESNALYVGCAVAAGVGLLFMAWHLLRQRQGRSMTNVSAWASLAPMAIVVSLLGIAASGASCGVACIAWGTPAAAAAALLPDLRGWFSRRSDPRQSRRQPLRRL